MCQRYAGRAITGQIKTTPVEEIMAEADHPTVATRATQLCVIAMEKSVRIPDANPRKQIATSEALQRMQMTCWRNKASEVLMSIIGSTQQVMSPGLLPPWLQIGNHVFDVDGVKSDEAEKNKILALKRLTKDFRSYDLTIYMECSATN